MSAQRLSVRAALVAALVAIGGAALGVTAAGGDSLLAILVALLVAAVLGALVGFNVAAPSARSLAEVSETADLVAAGKLGERAIHPTPATEDLVASFNHMIDRTTALVQQTENDRVRIEAVFLASADAMVAVDRETHITALNPAALALFEADAGAAVGRPLIEVVRDYEIDAIVRSVAANGLAEERTPIAFGSQRRPLRVTAVPISGGGDWAVLLVLIDLTEVQRFDAIRRDFLSNVSHEVRTPLASIRALVDIIEADDVDDAEQRRIFVGHIQAQVERMTSLVEELLDLSRIESGAIHLQPEELDLAELIREVADSLQQQLKAKAVCLETPDPPGPAVQADHRAVVRVFTNLIDNAIKYSPEGGSVRVSFIESTDVVSVSFADDGPGINPANLPRVFERFYKADSARSTPGAGLGLAIVKHLVRAHSGTAEVASEPGAGATFTVRFPREFIGPEPRHGA